MIRVIHIPVEGAPRAVEIDGSLEAMQKLVGGYLEPVSFGFDGLDLFVDEEGKLKKRARNPHFSIEGDIIVGDAILVRHDKHGDPVDLEEDDLAILEVLS